MLITGPRCRAAQAKARSKFHCAAAAIPKTDNADLRRREVGSKNRTTRAAGFLLFFFFVLFF